MGFFKSIQKVISKANNVVNKVMGVTDPIGAYLKKTTETKSQAAANTMLGGLFGGVPKPENSYEDLGGTATSAVSDEAMQSAKGKKFNKDKQRRQGFSGGSTLLTSTEEDENQQLNKNTLLGM